MAAVVYRGMLFMRAWLAWQFYLGRGYLGAWLDRLEIGRWCNNTYCSNQTQFDAISSSRGTRGGVRHAVLFL